MNGNIYKSAIIDPSTLTQEQREEIRKIYINCTKTKALLEEEGKAYLIKNKVVAFQTTYACGMNDGAMAAMTKIFGKSMFDKKGE